MNLYEALEPYQQEGVKFIMKHDKCGLFYEVGTGKTIITVTGFVALANKGQLPNGHILVIAPKPIARSSWIKELKKWHIPANIVSLVVDYDPERYKREYEVWKAKMDIISVVKSTYPDPCDLKKNKGITVNGVHYPPGKFLKPHATTASAEYKPDPRKPPYDRPLTPEKRLELYEGIATHAPAFYFINQEMIVDLIEWHIRNKRRWPFPTMVIDELHNFKGYKTVRFKTLKLVMPFVKRFVGLTGTPVPNNLQDLWAEMYLIDNGVRLGRFISHYRQAYFTPGRCDDQGRPYEFNIIPGKEQEIYDKISDVVISAKNINAKLPPVTIHDIDCYMDDDEMQIYKTMMKERVLDVMTANGEVSVTADNAAVLAGKLAQMASGTLYTVKGDNTKYVKIHDKKLEMLKYVIDNTSSPIIVAYRFVSDCNEIMKYLINEKYHVEICDGSPDMQDRWNNGEIPVMLLQPASMSEGLNIQDGGHTFVWYTVPDSLKSYIQTNGRLCRTGQKYPVVIHRFLTKGTIDHRIAASLNKKEMTQEELMSAVRLAIQDNGDYDYDAP